MSPLIILPIGSIIGFSWILSRRTAISTEVAPIVALSSIVLVLFCADFLRLSQPVSLALLVGGLLCAAIEARRYIAEHGSRAPVRSLLPLAGICFIALLLIDYNSNSIFVEWDEFSHWGTAIKLTLYANTAIYLVPQGFPLYFQDYPPGSAYAAYYFLRVTGYQESVAILVHALILFAASLPLIGFAGRIKPVFGAVMSAVVFVFVIRNGAGWSSVLIDQIVGVLFGASLSVFWLERDRPAAWMALPPILGFLVLSKGSGFFFALLVIGFLLFVYALRLLLAFKLQKKGLRVERQAILIISLCALVTVCASQMWAFHLRVHDIPTSLAGIPFSSLISKAAKCCETEREDFIASHFKKRMFGLEDHAGNATDLTDGEGQLSLNKLVSSVFRKNWNAPGKLLLLALVCGGLIATMYKAKVDRAGYGAFVGFCCIGGVGYCLMLLLYYMYAFGDYEGRALASMERFFSSYMYGLAYLLLAGITGVMAEADRRVWIARAAFFLALLFVVGFGRGKALEYLRKGGATYTPQRTEISRIIHPFIDVTSPRAAVLVVWQIENPSQNGLEYWMLRYELSPRTVNVLCFSFGPPLYAGDIWTCNWSEDRFLEALKDNDYVFVGSGLQSVRGVYPNIFKGADSMKNSQVFRVIKKPDQRPSLESLSDTLLAQ